MRKLLASVAAFLIFAPCYAQYSYEVVNSQQVRKDLGPIATDNNGNTIITGYFANSITLGTITLTHTTGADVWFVAKRLSNGIFAWAKKLTPVTITGGSSDSHIYGVSTDATGNVYITGNFVGKISFANNIVLTSTINGTAHTSDIFIAKISSNQNGKVLWAKSTGTANDGCNAGEVGLSVATDNAGDAYITGQIVSQVFQNTTVCNDIPGGTTCSNATSKSITCPFVVKYSASGNKIWERKYLNNGALASTSCWYNHPQGTYIGTDGSNIYVTGYFYGTVDFGAGPLSTGSETVSNTFLIKLNAAGTTLWSRSVTGNANYTYGVGDGLFVNGNDVYISGIGENISFGACYLPSGGGAPSFLAKYSSSGSCQWAVKPRGISYGVVKHPNGNLAMLRRGTFYSIREYSPLDGSLIDSTETPLADTATGAVGGYPSIASLPNGFVFSQMVTGTYHFGNLTVAASVPKGSGWPDMMLIKYSTTPPAIVNLENTVSKIDYRKLVLYPNPANNQITIQNSDQKILGTISIYNLSGQVIYKKFVGSPYVMVDIKDFSTGVYYIRLEKLDRVLKFVKE